MQTENEYFNTVLKIFESGLNFGDVLEKGGIKPSSTDTYKVSICPPPLVCYSIPMCTRGHTWQLCFGTVTPVTHHSSNACLLTGTSCVLEFRTWFYHNDCSFSFNLLSLLIGRAVCGRLQSTLWRGGRSQNGLLLRTCTFVCYSKPLHYTQYMRSPPHHKLVHDVVNNRPITTGLDPWLGWCTFRIRKWTF